MLVEPYHAGVFAIQLLTGSRKLRNTLADLGLPFRVSIDDRRERGRLGHNLGAKGIGRHKARQGLSQGLADAFIAGVEKSFVADERPANAGSELMQTKRRL